MYNLLYLNEQKINDSILRENQVRWEATLPDFMLKQ
jgi:hypothetical protein